MKKLTTSVILATVMFLNSFAQGDFLYPQKLYPFQAENGKFGFTAQNGKLLVFPKYDEVKVESEGFAAVKLGKFWGFINETGKEVVAARFTDVGNFSEGLAPANSGEKWGFINQDGQNVIDFKYEYAETFSQGLAVVRIKGKYGYIDRNGKTQIPFQYDDANSFAEGFAKVFKGELITDKQAFIDKKGNLLTDFVYDHDMYTYNSWNDTRDLQEGMMMVAKNGKRGYINNKGKEVIPTKYDRISPLHKGWAAYFMNDMNKWGLLYKSGKELTMPLFDEVDFSYLDQGYELIVTIRLEKSASGTIKKYGLFNTAGERNLTLPYYEELSGVSEGMIAMKVNGRYGYLDSTGRQVITPKYDYAGTFANGAAIVAVDDKYGLINKTGKEIVPLKYEGAENFSEGLAAVQLNSKVGFVDMNGREVIAPKYSGAYSFYNGTTVVTDNSKFGCIDKTGKAITEVKYDDMTQFVNDVAVVVVNGKYGLINKAGKEIIAPTYEALSLSDTYLYFSKGGKWGVMRPQGEIVVPAQFEGFAQPFIGETAVGFKSGKAVYVDKTGKVVGELNQ